MTNGRLLPDGPRGVDPGDQALRGGLLVARRAVDLPGEEEARDRLGLECRAELGRRGVVVLDGVAVPHDLGVFEARHHRDDRLLDVAGQARGDAVAVILEGVPPFGLEEDLVLSRSANRTTLSSIDGQ